MRGYPAIDSSMCTLCGRCVNICPKEILGIRNGIVEITGDDCMLCSHCYSICPETAVSFDPLDLCEVIFPGMKDTDRMAVNGELDPSLLVRFLRSRRSVRRFRKKTVPDRSLDILVRSAVLAPSGSNCQAWEFTIINGRERVWNIALEMSGFFRRLNRLAANPLVRWLSVPLAGWALVRYNRDHRETVEWALSEGDRGRDLLFHGAPCLVILHGSSEGSTPAEDIQYASYNMALMAHAMGLGSCYIGFATEALNRMATLRRKLGVRGGNRVYAVLALGYPAVRFERGALRKPWREIRDPSAV